MKSYVQFEDIQSTIEIKNPSVFREYLKEIFKELSSSGDSIKKIGISMNTFVEYLDIPIYISEKLFQAVDMNKDGLLNIDEFCIGMLQLYVGTLKETSEIIFRFLDFDSDGLISKGDVRMILSYMQLKRRSNQNFPEDFVKAYEDQMEHQREIGDILLRSFENGGDKLDYSQFEKVITSVASDIYMQTICYFYMNKPFANLTIETFSIMKPGQAIPNNPSTVSNNFINEDTLHHPSSSVSLIPFQSRSCKSKLLPADDFLKRFFEDETLNPFLLDPQQTTENSQTIPKQDYCLDIVLDIKDLTIDHTHIHASSNTQPNECPPLSQVWNKKRSKSLLVSKKQNCELIHEGWLFKITESKKVKRFWNVLIGKDIFYFKNEKKEELYGMHHLSGCFLKDNTDLQIIEGRKLYGLTLSFSHCSRNFYSLERNELAVWNKCFKKALNFQNFFDFYEVLGDLGQGKFGFVKFGRHIKSGMKVAIKILKKTQMTPNDIALVKYEIDIMRLCKHPNIVKLVDYMENLEYIFIVMECLLNGSLEGYLQAQKFKIGEKVAAEIIFQIAEGIEYLHGFGIIHRDLKPENIMLADTVEDTGKISVKIMDFGLSKILGPYETACDGYGTLTFVAPEILIRTPYNREIDIWSIGVILYYMLSGILPFDDDSNDEEIIAKKTVFTQLEFSDKNFATRSPEVINLITKCLVKEPNNRISIYEILKNEWIVTNCLK